MTTKYRISFPIDLAPISPEDLSADAARQVAEKLFAAARKVEKDELHRIRKSSAIDADEKAKLMAECLRAIMATLSAEANLSIEPLPIDAFIETKLPFEKEYDLEST